MSNVEGLDELIRKLHNLEGVSPHAMLAGAFTLQKYSQEEAPVLTGFLKSSPESRETDKGAEVEYMANYAYYQEFGTANMPAHPFIRPAIDGHGDDIVKAVAGEIQADIKRRAA